jgi:hypothetical protein
MSLDRRRRVWNPKWMSRRQLLAAAGAGVAAAAVGTQPEPAAAARRPVAGVVRVSGDGFGLHAEPCVAANPRNPQQLLAACMVGPVGRDETIAAYATFDGGRSWHSHGPLTMPPGISYANDVTVGYDQLGHGYVCAMGTSGQSPDGLDRGVWLWMTRDGGRSFRPAEAAVSGMFVDHPWLAVGAGGLHVAWVAEHHAALGYTRSVRGGRFEDPRVLPIQDGDTVDSPMTAAGPRGQVCVVYGAPAGPDGKQAEAGTPGDGGSGDLNRIIRVVSSTDGGHTFARPVTLGPSTTRISLPGGVIANSGPTVAAAPHGRALYAAHPVHEPGAGHSDIVVAASYDSGATWSEPTTATPDDDVVYFQPQLAVDVRGRVILSAFALRDNLIDLVVLTSPGGPPLRFGTPQPVTTTPFDPALAADGNPKHGAWWVGDYQGLAATPNAIHAVWNDTRTGNLELFSATLRGRELPEER